MNENLLIYYFCSGIFMSIICFIFYERVAKEIEAVEWVGKTVFVGINFFFGFLNAPIAIMMFGYEGFLRIRLYFLQKRNDRLKKQNEFLKTLQQHAENLKNDSIKSLENINEQLKNKNHENNN